MSDVPIQHQVMQLATRFECETGKRPINLYLGDEQYGLLYEYILYICHHTLADKVEEELTRPRFMGLQLFRVDSKSHIGVSL